MIGIERSPAIATSTDQIFSEIQALPIRDRLRLLERVIRALQQPGNEVGKKGASTSSLIGLLADTPEVADQINRITEEERRSRGWRTASG
jgi:hypothetical protein